MRVFVTGATGFIGTAIVQELLNAGHDVLGLARSAASAEALGEAGADVHLGDLEDLDSLRSGAKECDGVIHAGFIHDFSRFQEVCQIDKVAIEAIGEALEGSDRPLIVTSGTALVRPGTLATEDMMPAPGGHPRLSEVAADIVADKGVRVSSIRLSPSVHGEGDLSGFVPMLIKTAREKGFAAYIGDGQNHWNAVHRLDAAHLYRLALEGAVKGARFHGSAEEAIPFKSIAEAIGKGLNLPVRSLTPEEAQAHFGWFAGFAGIDCPASSEITQRRLNWHPTHQTLMADMEQGIYFK
jgi:nucleoside-diphosphate-sugar epimerase